jgi:hypothetical protein
MKPEKHLVLFARGRLELRTVLSLELLGGLGHGRVFKALLALNGRIGTAGDSAK